MLICFLAGLGKHLVCGCVAWETEHELAVVAPQIWKLGLFLKEYGAAMMAHTDACFAKKVRWSSGSEECLRLKEVMDASGS